MWRVCWVCWRGETDLVPARLHVGRLDVLREDAGRERVWVECDGVLDRLGCATHRPPGPLGRRGHHRLELAPADSAITVFVGTSEHLQDIAVRNLLWKIFHYKNKIFLAEKLLLYFVFFCFKIFRVRLRTTQHLE